MATRKKKTGRKRKGHVWQWCSIAHEGAVEGDGELRVKRAEQLVETAV